MVNKTKLDGTDCYGRSMVRVVSLSINLDTLVVINDWYQA